jgi:hypothetical protein
MNQPVCGHCHRNMHYTEWMPLYNEKENLNDVICPECFKKETGCDTLYEYAIKCAKSK